MRFIYTKTFAALFIALGILALLMFLNSRGGLDQIRRFFLRLPGPIVRLSSGIGVQTKTFFSTLYNLRGLARENNELKNKISSLQADLSLAQADIRDNEILRKELGFVKNTRLDLQPCEVLSANTLKLADSLILNCGSELGLAEGQAVISQSHLVGKLTFVGKNTSTALLATSSKFLADARVSKTGQVGVVKGSFNAGLLLDQLPQSAELEKNWLIVTAGINPQIPKDLLIGEVGQIISSPNDLFKNASLLSPVDFNNLQFVYIVK